MKRYKKMPGTVGTVTEHSKDSVSIPQSPGKCNPSDAARGGIDGELAREAHALLVERFRLGYEDGLEGIKPRYVTAEDVLACIPGVTPEAERAFRILCGHAEVAYRRGWRKGRNEWKRGFLKNEETQEGGGPSS